MALSANELMIGDWVVKTHLIGRKDSYKTQVSIDELTCLVNGIINCHPIPLTPEILEKNGFWWGLTTDQEDMLSYGLGVPISVHKSWIWEDEDGCKVVLDFPNEADGGQVWCHTDKKDSSMGWLDEIYAHELQHALRLCGLNDLADSIII